MMATIRATCHDCGDVDLTSGDLTVRVCADDNGGSYVFRCPQCTMAVVRSVPPRMVELLTASGCRQETWQMPAELTEPRQGPPICHDDLIEFHRALEAL